MAAREPLDIIGGFYRDENLHWSDQDVLNYLPITAEKKGTRTVTELRQAPGLRPLVDIYTVEDETIIPSGPVRGMRNVEGRLFVVAGRGLYEITAGLICIPRGVIPGLDLVSMDHNQNGAGNQLSIDNGSARYVYHTATEVFQKVIDTGFPGSTVSFYIDGYMGYVDPNGQRWGHSALKNALEYNDIDRYTAEGLPDGIVTAAVSHREVLIFGSQTIEPYVNTGAATGTFKRAANTVIECGCAAPRSVASMDNSLMWLDDQLLIRRLDGYNPVRVSTNGIEQALAEYPLQQVTRAFSYAWEDRGHKVYYITVPGGHTFGLDALSGEWHRRASGTSTRLRFNALVKWNGMWVGGDYQSGRLYQVDWRYFMDGCDPLVRRRRTGVLSNNQNPVGVNELELLFNVGGPESECAEFPTQPSGPSISGDIPDGHVGLAWPGVTYTAAGGTLPYRFVQRPGSTFPGNLGPMSTAGVVPGATPTTAGAGISIPRVYDANGLFAEITDPFTIFAQPGVMMAQTNSTTTYYSATGGIVWLASANFPQAGNRDLKPIETDRFIANLRYTDDLGATAWAVATSTGTKNYQLARRASNVIWGANGPFEAPMVSSDDGVTCTSGGATGNGMYSLVYMDVAGPLIAVGKGLNFMASVDNAATFASTGVAHGFLDNNTSNASVPYSGGGVFAGTNIANTALRVVFTGDGVALTGGDITGLGNTSVTVGKNPSMITVGEIDGVETVVVLAEKAGGGELFWTQDMASATPEWNLVTDPLGAGAVCSGIAWNGVRFVLVGNLATNGLMKYSANLTAWTDCTFPACTGFYAISSHVPAVTP